MTQLELFTSAPLARKSDPATSHIAAAAIEPRLSEQQKEVLRLVENMPGRTSAEMAVWCSSRYALAMIRRRLPELVRLGYVRTLEPRKCRELGTMQTVYEATGKRWNNGE